MLFLELASTYRHSCMIMVVILRRKPVRQSKQKKIKNVLSTSNCILVVVGKGKPLEKITKSLPNSFIFQMIWMVQKFSQDKWISFAIKNLNIKKINILKQCKTQCWCEHKIVIIPKTAFLSRYIKIIWITCNCMISSKFYVDPNCYMSSFTDRIGFPFQQQPFCNAKFSKVCGPFAAVLWGVYQPLVLFLCLVLYIHVSTFYSGMFCIHYLSFV